MNPKYINIITNVLAVILAIWEPVRAYLMSQPFDWKTFVPMLVTAVVAYFTGKSGLFVQKENKPQ